MNKDLRRCHNEDMSIFNLPIHQGLLWKGMPSFPEKARALSQCTK